MTPFIYHEFYHEPNEEKTNITPFIYHESNGGQDNMNTFTYHELTKIATLLDEIQKIMKELKEVRKDEHQQE